MARYRANRPAYLFKRFGLLPADIEALDRRAAGKCEICGNPPSGKRVNLSVDHDHVTHEVRGLLCSRCNLDLQAIERGPEWIEKALAYLKQPRIKTMNSLVQSSFDTP